MTAAGKFDLSRLLNVFVCCLCISRRVLLLYIEKSIHVNKEVKIIHLQMKSVVILCKSKKGTNFKLPLILLHEHFVVIYLNLLLVLSDYVIWNQQYCCRILYQCVYQNCFVPRLFALF